MIRATIIGFLVIITPICLLAFSEETITYYSDSTISLKATIYTPEKDTLKPALVLIHEGGFTSGSRFCFNQYGAYFTGRGYVVMSIDYRLVQQGGAYPVALKDCIEAVKWLKANHRIYQVDKERIALIGSSAGAYLATMIGLAKGLPADIRQGHGKNKGEDTSVRVVVSSFGVYDWEKTEWKGDGFINPDQEKEASPIQYAEHAGAAFLLLAGGRDRLFNKEQAEEFKNRIKAKDKTVELYVKSRQGHAGLCDINSPLVTWALPIINSFLLDKLERCIPCERNYRKPE